MAQMTLLEITQSVLNSMDDDNVNTIEETESSEQVALVCKEVYYELIQNADWPHLQQVIPLTSVSDVTQPTYLKIPDSVGYIDKLFYDITEAGDTNEKLHEVTYMEPWDFMELLFSRNTGNSNITKYSSIDGTPLYIRTDKFPDYYTSFDDEYLVCDSFHSTTESTLQGSRTTTVAKKEPAWTHTDLGVPDLPDQMFPLYLARCKVKCHAYFRQTVNNLDEQEAQRGKARFRQVAQRTRERHRRKTYGR